MHLNLVKVGGIMFVSEEIRRARRKHLIYFVRVRSSSEESFTGRLVNISSKGLKLITKENLFLGDTYHLDISLPEKMYKLKNIVCMGKTMWHRRSTSGDHFSAGFEIVEIDEINKDGLNELIKDFVS